jgi:hypothetical protein
MHQTIGHSGRQGGEFASRPRGLDKEPIKGLDLQPVGRRRQALDQAGASCELGSQECMATPKVPPILRHASKTPEASPWR